MLSDLVFVMILIYFACFSGIVFGCVLTLRTTKAWVASLAATLFIICVICLYASTVAFIDEIKTEIPNFKLIVGGEGFRDKIKIFFSFINFCI